MKIELLNEKLIEKYKNGELYLVEGILCILYELKNTKKYWFYLKEILNNSINIIDINGKDYIEKDSLEYLVTLLLDGKLPSYYEYKREKNEGSKYKGYGSLWIEYRKKTLSSRNNLIGEWMKRDIKTYQINSLTNILTASLYGMNVEDYLIYKGLDKNDNLRDSMSELELYYLSMVEEQTRLLHISNNSFGYDEIKKDCILASKMILKVKENYEKNNNMVITNIDYKRIAKYNSR